MLSLKEIAEVCNAEECRSSKERSMCHFSAQRNGLCSYSTYRSDRRVIPQGKKNDPQVISLRRDMTRVLIHALRRPNSRFEEIIISLHTTGINIRFPRYFKRYLPMSTSCQNVLEAKTHCRSECIRGLKPNYRLTLTIAYMHVYAVDNLKASIAGVQHLIVLYRRCLVKMS